MLVRQAALLILLSLVSLSKTQNPWKWTCNSTRNLCKRISNSTENADAYNSIEICRLVCGRYAGLWPQPSNATIESRSPQLIIFSMSSVNFVFHTPDESTRNYLQSIADIFTHSKPNGQCVISTEVTVEISVKQSTSQLFWGTDESYQLEVQIPSITITSSTVFGARHALETLGQLIEPYFYADGTSCYATVRAKIADAPAFTHRGLLLDTSRNFLSLEAIRKHIVAMASVKLNVFHWHITDSQSFPLDLPSQPKMAQYGAYSSKQVYTISEIRDIVGFAKLRGVRVLIEIDGPSHTGFGWQWGPGAALGNLTVCQNQQPWRSFCIQPPCGQLNPANPNVYRVLRDIYSDILDVLGPQETLHLGGDEVFIPCWNSSEEILRYLGRKPRTTDTFLELWSEFQRKALAVFDEVGGAGKKVAVWSSHLTQPGVVEAALPKERYVIQTWVPSSDDLPESLLDLGYNVIISTKDHWYLDHGFWGRTRYYDWRSVYNNRISNRDGVLGGEVCMWGEYVDDTSIDSRVWPRAAAAAERLWTNPGQLQWTEQRFYRHRQRLLDLGINADAVAPKWCLQNEGECK